MYLSAINLENSRQRFNCDDGDVAVLVAGDALQIGHRQIFGQALGQHHDAEFFSFILFASNHRRHEAIDHFLDVHDVASRLLAGSRIDHFFGAAVFSGDVFDADHGAGFARHGHAVGQPAGAAAHGFDEKVRAAGFGVAQQVATFGGQRVDGRKIAERKVDAHVVVVDRLGQVDQGHPRLVLRQAILIQLELVGRFQRIVAADRDHGIDADRPQGLVDRT